jgi:hypothetical protein
MRKSKFTEEQIAMALRQGEAGTPVADICRKLGISQATFYRWKKVYGGIGRHRCPHTVSTPPHGAGVVCRRSKIPVSPCGVHSRKKGIGSRRKASHRISASEQIFSSVRSITTLQGERHEEQVPA